MPHRCYGTVAALRQLHPIFAITALAVVAMNLVYGIANDWVTAGLSPRAPAVVSVPCMVPLVPPDQIAE